MAEAVVGLLILKIGSALATEFGKSIWSLSKEEATVLLALRSDMGDIKSELEMIQAFIRQADQESEGKGPTAVWVSQVREAAYHIEDVIDEFTYFVGEQKRKGLWDSVAKTIRLPCRIKDKHVIAMQLQDIKIMIEGISKRRIRYDVKGLGDGSSSNDARERPAQFSHFLGEDSQVVGMKKSEKMLMRWLREERKELVKISVWGMIGIGKTRLVAEVYKSEEVKKDFNCRSWVTVSKTSKTDVVLRSIIKEFFVEEEEMLPQGIDEMDKRRLVQILHQHLQLKRYLIVFDDVWNNNVWEEIQGTFPDNTHGSIIIFTTRNHDTATSLASRDRIFHIQRLNHREAWTLFSSIAFRGDDKVKLDQKLEEAAIAIVEKCEGLPLAIVTIASVMYSKERSAAEWNNVVHGLNWMFDNQKLEKLSNILMLSFYDLPYYLKNCFLYCSAFPEYYSIKRKRIIRLWVAEGFVEESEGMTMEEIAEEYLKELVQRSMLVAQAHDCGRVKQFHMHDVVRNIAVSMSKKQNFFMMLESRTTAKARRLSVIKANNFIQKGLGDMTHLRSLLVFEMDDFFSRSLIAKSALRFRLLRVLDLQNAPIQGIPDAVGDLFNLRYLSLRGTKVRMLPKSLASLQNLLTLDLKFSSIEELPSLRKLQNLRHLFLISSVEDGIWVPMKSNPREIWASKDLQTLEGIMSSKEIVRQVGNLTQLRSLSILEVEESDAPELCASISKMTFLTHLKVQAKSKGVGPLKMEPLHYLPFFLQKLILRGNLMSLPRWCGSLPSLRVLSLRSSGLREDPLRSLQQLPVLEYLVLHKAYDGKKLCFQVNSFPSLKKLSLIELSQLNQVTIKKGAMQSLRSLSLVRCGELETLPQGIEGLTKLEHLYLEDMPEDLLERMREGEDHQKIKDIDSVMHCSKRDDKVKMEYFT